jgi:diaminohydroxyphosphoribosylaminopyrimidine deaminase/5-amino-6-(5-phosphoribosylamino)uracil reductase
MRRCLQLAEMAAGDVAPNPMVGAVLVYEGRIIAEGYHQQYGGPHAEVNCIRSVKEEDRSLISQSTLYVSLEPCAHFGKTPPCADLIIQCKIPRVVIGCRDPFKEVDGKGIERLQKAGVDVISDVLEDECRELNKRFFCFHTKQRPYIILKWAQTADGIIGRNNGQRLLISNEYSNRMVHQWRSEEMGIMVGTNTSLMDDPELTSRLWPGRNPVRIVIDKQLRLPASLRIFNEKAATIVFNQLKDAHQGNIEYVKIEEKGSFINAVLNSLYERNIQSVIVEGGAHLLQSFINENLWDEARVINNGEWRIENTSSVLVKVPQLKNAVLTESRHVFSDTIYYYNPVPDK